MRPSKTMVAYLRVSSDDKDQRPERQKRFLESYADQNDIEVVAWIVDEGTSASKVPPLQRQKVHEAIKAARLHGASAILVENLDRWSRGGFRELAVTEVRMEDEHDLKVVMADLPSGEQGLAYEIIRVVKAEMAAEYTRLMGERIRQGLALAKRNAWPKGRPGNPGKPPLSPDEREFVAQMRAQKPEPLGWRRIAVAVSDRRGAFEIADPKRRNRKTVSATWVKYQFEQQGRPQGSRPDPKREPNAEEVVRLATTNKTPVQNFEQEGGALVD